MGLTVLPLGIKDIVQSDQVLGLIHSTGAYAPQFLHVRAYAQQQTQVHAEGSDVGASLAADPEDTEMTVVVELDKLGLVDGSDAELSLDGRDQGRSLEQGASKKLEDARKLGLAAGDLVVESHNRHVLLSCTLLRLDKSRGPVDANDETPCDLGVEGTAVAGLFYAEHALDPCDDFVGGGIGGFVELHTIRQYRGVVARREIVLTLMTPEETTVS